MQEIKAARFGILDPVDGTTNLMHDYQHSVVSLALCCQGEIVMGVIYDPFREEVFSAVKGKGSFLNGQSIYVSNAEKLSDTMNVLTPEAGGQVTDFTGKSLDPRKGNSVVGTNSYIHDELLRLL